MIVQEAPRTAGYGAELAAILAEKAILDLHGPVLRVTGYDVPYPYWQIEDAYMPSVERVAGRRAQAPRVLKTPPYRIVTERLVLRCWEPRDAAALKEAVDASLDHLRPWMPWAENEPQTIEEKVELIRGFRGLFDTDEDYVYGIFSRDESEVCGRNRACTSGTARTPSRSATGSGRAAPARAWRRRRARR